MENSSTPRIIAIANNKGGQGKTTTALALASLMASSGKRVLLVDLDAQANATIASGIAPETDQTLYATLVNKKPLHIFHVDVKEGSTFDLVASDLQLSWLDLQMAGQFAREQILKAALQPILGQYDEILLDCPPQLGLITQCAFTAATDVLIPLTADSFAIEGLKMIINFYQMIRQSNINPTLRIMGMVLTQYEKNTLSKSSEETLRQAYSKYLFNTKIRKNIAVGKSQATRTDLITDMPDCNAAKDYTALFQELQEKNIA